MLNMAELSAAANTLALVAIAGQSCHFLYKFLSRIPKASNDIQHHILLLRGLRSTFANIETLGQNIELDRITVLHFHTRVQECMDDLQTMQLRLMKLRRQLRAGHITRTWAVVRWALIKEELLTHFFHRIQIYHTTFSLDLLKLHM